MLTVITGSAMSCKDEIIHERIKRAVLSDKQVYVFVPDQFSFEYDKMLYEIFGVKLFNRINVMGLNRFAKQLKKKFGNKNGETADDNTRAITMYKAIRNFKSENKSVYYTRNLEKTSFVTQMLDMTAQLRKNEILPQSLETASFKTKGVLSDKLKDISGIYGFYNKLLEENELSDGVSCIAEATQILAENSFFENCEVFFDRYDTFSADEYKLIEIMLHQCENVSVALTLSDENNSKSCLTPFASTIKTKSSLEKIAKTVGIETEHLKSNRYHYNKASLVHVNANIFCVENHPSQNHEGVKVALVQDMYDEVSFVASEIKRLVREQKYRYSDIAVISRQLGEYAPIIEGTFERYEIPSFIDAKQSVSKSVLAIYISSVLECLKGKSFRTEKLLRMIKSPLSPFKDFEVSAIEEYAYTWGVDGDMWKEPFTATDRKLNNLSTINAVREKIVAPIINFRNSVADCNASELISAFVKLLGEFELTSCANRIAKQSVSFENKKSFITDKSDELELVREFRQLWTMFTDALVSINDNLGNERLTTKEFSELVTLLVSGMSVSNPPQRINTVTVASAEHSRLSAVKAVFVLGVNADRLPAAAVKGGMFTEREKKQLSEVGIELSASAVDNIRNERLVAYLALTQGSDRLYVCCPETDKKGKPLSPSGIVRELFAMFGDSIKIDAKKLGADFYCQTKRSAYSRLSECLNDNSSSSETLKAVMLNIPDYKDKVQKLFNNAKNTEFSLSPDLSRQLFFTHNDPKSVISLSPSSIDKYNKCPFNFFCDYGLKLREPVKKEINGINRGNLIHHVLENLLSVKNDGVVKYNEDFESLTEQQVEKLIEEYAEQYKQLEMGGDFGKNERFSNLYKRIQKNAVMVVMNIQEELKNSFFKPCAFEYSITKENGESMLNIETDDVVINVRGFIDRIDTYTDDNGKTYLKVVDYKTGTVKNLFLNIFHGVTLQLVIYLFALLEGENDLGISDAEPGGIIYTPAVYVKSTTNAKEDKKPPTQMDDEQLMSVKAGFTKDYVRRKLERFGIIRNDEELLTAFNNSGDKKFFPSGNNSVFDVESIYKIGEHTKNMIKSVGESLFEGKINADPLADATQTPIKKPCSYCSYSAVCGVKNSKPKKFVVKQDADVFNKQISDDGEVTEIGE